MKLSELKLLLRQHPEALPHFLLPDGDEIPAHFHVTEIGQVAKRFIDCGGVLHERTETCLLQTHVGDDVDHRLTAGRLAKILELAAGILPSDELEVEVEYDCCVVSQYPIVSAEFTGREIELQLGGKGTACLAQERRANKGERATAASCC